VIRPNWLLYAQNGGYTGIVGRGVTASWPRFIGKRMGVRFECPNGHKLNVKAFLAGKRGICPHCDSKFIIPLTSGGQATAVESEPEPIAEASTPPAESAPVAASPVVPSIPPAKGEATVSPDIWYVRPAKGDEQFGPASTEAVRSWIAEGRVAADSWVWKTGWTEWKFGSEAFAELQQPATDLPKGPVGNDAPAIHLKSQVPVDSRAKKPPRKSPRSRQQRAQKITVILGALVLLLGIAVVLVLTHSIAG